MSHGWARWSIVPARRAGMLTAGWLLLLCGCASWKGPSLDTTAGLYDEATLRYTIDASRLGTPMVASRVEAQQVSYDAIPTAPLDGQCTGTLLVEYPHPEATDGMARATVEIKAADANLNQPRGAKGWWQKLRGRDESTAAHERWVLDIPRGQLDQVLDRLNQSGYFGDNPEVPNGIELEVALSGSKVAKTWTQMPELDALVMRVRGQGQLVDYQRSPSAARHGTLDKLLAARAVEDRRTGSYWPSAPAAPMMARSRAGAWPVESIPAVTIAGPQAAPVQAVQPVSYFAPLSPPAVPATTVSPATTPAHPEVVPLPPVGRSMLPPPPAPTNLPPEVPLTQTSPMFPASSAGNVARLPSPPAAMWR